MQLERQQPTAKVEVGGAWQRAFTMVELIVSIGLLALTMVLAGAVFSLTTKSSGQATALIEVEQAIRALEQTLREDLRYVEPGSSMMIIQGNRVSAYWTQDAKEADGDGNPLNGVPGSRDPEREIVEPATADVYAEVPRADVLMVFTARPGRTYTQPPQGMPRLEGRLQQVVYGHAELGELSPSSAGGWLLLPPSLTSLPPSGTASFFDVTFDPTTPFNPFSANPSQFDFPAAREWVLARRSVLILDGDSAYEQQLINDGYQPAADLNDSDETGSDQYYILDGRRDFIINHPSTAGTGFSFARDVKRDQAGFVSTRPWLAEVKPPQAGPPAGTLLPWFARSQVDVDPPPAHAWRLGHYILPQCASFKVEWLLSPMDEAIAGHFRAMSRVKKEAIWVDPADVEAAVARAAAWIGNAASPEPDDYMGHLVGKGWGPMDIGRVETLLGSWVTNTFVAPGSRFARSGVGSNHVFYARMQEAGGNGIPVLDPLFPRALRITVDVYDRAGRLERPIRHVMILPVGRGA
jgi:type II secretory pathway pseudopilin PulG